MGLAEALRRATLATIDHSGARGNPDQTWSTYESPSAQRCATDVTGARPKCRAHDAEGARPQPLAQSRPQPHLPVDVEERARFLSRFIGEAEDE
jgi:hypothetical protein